MTGAQLKTARENLELPLETLATQLGVTPDVLAQWESTEVPATHASQIDWLLWEREKSKALASCGLPECVWLTWWNAQPPNEAGAQDLDTVEKHIAGCECCQARVRYIQEHVRPAPESNALGAQVRRRLPGWALASLAGAFIILVAGGGSGAAELLMSGRPADALLVVLLCALAGGAAGLVYHFTRTWHNHFLGVHLAWMLIGATYVFSAILCSQGIARIIDAPEMDWEFDLFLYPFMGAVAVIGGLVFGYAEQWSWNKSGKRRFRFREWLLPALAAVAIWLLIGGITAVLLGRRDYPLAVEASPDPQVLTLQQLIDKGYSNNRHVLVKDFRLCDQDVLAKTFHEGFSLKYYWMPVVPQTDAGKNTAVRPGVPPRVQALLYESRFATGDPAEIMKLRLLQNLQLETIEVKGYQGVVANGIKELSGKAQRDLQKLAPQTEFDKLLIIDRWTQPVSLAYVNRCLWIGFAVAALGSVLLLAVTILGLRTPQSGTP